MSFYNKSSLLTIPTAYKQGKLYSAKPTDGSGDFTFTRSTSATRVNSDGLIEKARENLLLYSNDFGNLSGWTDPNANITGGQAGYDGSNDAWELSLTGVFGSTIQFVSASGVNTFSFYAKAGTSNFMRPYIAGVNQWAYFDIANGITGFQNGITSSIESVGNGWYRCTFTVSGTISEVRIHIADSISSIGTSTSGSIYIQDAQLEAGLVATDYIETTTSTVATGITTNVPRIDYSSGTPALLLEPQRTNLVLQSEDFGNYINSNSTDVANATISPEGFTNATSFLEAATTGQHKLATSFNFDGTSIYTFSIFAKHNGRDLFIDTQNSNEWEGRAWFDLTNGTANAILGTAAIEDFGNGWYRCIVTGISNIAGANFVELLTSDGSTNSTTGDITKGVYIYGCQLEQGSYPTSYIPTYGTSVTRVADEIGLFQLSSYFPNPSKGTIFFEFEDKGHRGTGSSARFIFRNSNGNQLAFITRPDGFLFYDYNNQSYLITSGTQVGQTYKFAVTFNGKTSVGFADGLKQNTETSVNDFVINEWIFTSLLNNSFSFKKIMFFPTALSDAECITLTTI